MKPTMAPMLHPTTRDVIEFSRIFAIVRPDLSRYARSLAGNPDLAEDLVQDTAIRAWRSRGSFVEGTNFKAWVYRILRNCFLSHVRRKRVAKTDTYGDDHPEVAVASGQEMVLVLQDVGRYWDHLAPTQQRAIQLVGICGHSYDEAAAIENVSPGTLKSRVSRGRHALLELLERTTPLPIIGLTDDVSLNTILPEKSEVLDGVGDDTDRSQIAMLRAWQQRKALSF